MTHPPHDPRTGWPPEQQYPPAPVHPVTPQPAAGRGTNGLAVASMVVSLVGLLVCCGSVSGVVGAVLGHVARRQIRRTGQAGDGMALAGILVGWIGFVIFLLALTWHILFNVLVVKVPGL